MALARLKKHLGKGHVSHRVASPLLLTSVCKHLGTEESRSWTLVFVPISHTHLLELALYDDDILAAWFFGGSF